MRYRTELFVLLLVLLAAGPGAGPARGGSICGTVRNAVTTAPIARAGVFVRTQDGQYTGLHGATDEAGFFCIDLVPAGTWDLEIRVDNYQVKYLRGVEVGDGASPVDIELAENIFSFAPPWPNPARGRTWFRLFVGESGPVRLQVFDLRGRLVRRWTDPAAEPGERLFTWDLRDHEGKVVPGGVYLVRFTGGGSPLDRTVVVVR